MKVKKDYILSTKKILSYCTGSSFSVMLYGAMYLVSLWDPYTGPPRMEVALLNTDTGYSGSLPLSSINVGKTFQDLILKPDTVWAEEVAWKRIPPQTTRANLIQDIEKNLYWAAVIFPRNMSQTFSQNVYLNASQAQLEKTNVTCEIIYDQGRAFSVVNLMMNIIQFTMLNASRDMARELTIQVAQQGLTIGVGWEIEPIDITLTNIHGVRVFGHSLSTSLFFFLMWLGSSIGVTVFRQDFYKYVDRKTDTSIVRHQLNLLFYPVGIGLLFIFTHALAGWSIVFAVSGMASFSPVEASDSLAPLRTLMFLWYIGLCPLFINGILHLILPINIFPVVTSLTLVLNLVSAGSLFDYVQIPDFFKLGYVLPMRYAVRQLRYMFFGTLAETVTENLIMLSLWVFIPCFVYLGVLLWKIRSYLHTIQNGNQVRNGKFKP